VSEFPIELLIRLFKLL